MSLFPRNLLEVFNHTVLQMVHIIALSHMWQCGTQKYRDALICILFCLFTRKLKVKLNLLTLKVVEIIFCPQKKLHLHLQSNKLLPLMSLSGPQCNKKCIRLHAASFGATKRLILLLLGFTYAIVLPRDP